MSKSTFIKASMYSSNLNDDFHVLINRKAALSGYLSEELRTLIEAQYALNEEDPQILFATTLVN